MELNDDQINDLLRAYLPKIIRLAEGKINARYATRFDADDVAATVCRTVFRRISEGTFTFDDDESLWRQLVAVTHRRLSNKIRHEDADKRAASQTVQSEDNLFAGLSREPNPSDAAAFVDLIEQVSQQLDETGRRVLELRMASFDYADIAEELGISDRTVGRKIQVIKELLEES